MNILEAAKSGKQYKRKNDPLYVFTRCEDPDFLADDFVVLEKEHITISIADLSGAVSRVQEDLGLRLGTPFILGVCKHLGFISE